MLKNYYLTAISSLCLHKEKTQEKCIEYIHCFYDVNEMVYIVITIVNIPLILYRVFFR